MEYTLPTPGLISHRWSSVYLALFGCCLITLSSFIKIPFYPVWMTLHTLAIFILALTLTPKQAFWSVCCYLFCGTIGLPVFSGTINTLWMMGKSGGYFVSFPIAAYLISRMAKTFRPFIAILAGQFVIYLLGFLWLAPFVGAKVALMHGVIFFIPSAVIKNLAAISITKSWKSWS